MCIFIFGKGGGSGSGPDLSKVTARPEYVLSPYKYVDKGGALRTGAISNFAGEPAEGAASGDHFTINPSTDARHIPAGSYLGRAIDLPAMPQGSAVLSCPDNQTVRLTTTAGYIEAGTKDMAIPHYDDYSGPYSVIPSQQETTLATSGKVCTNDISVKKIGMYHSTTLKADTSHVIYLPYFQAEGESTYRKPLFFSLMYGNTASLGYIAALAASCATNRTFTVDGIDANRGWTTWTVTVEDQPSNSRVKLTVYVSDDQSAAVFKTGSSANYMVDLIG